MDDKEREILKKLNQVFKTQVENRAMEAIRLGDIGPPMRHAIGGYAASHVFMIALGIEEEVDQDTRKKGDEFVKGVLNAQNHKD